MTTLIDDASEAFCKGAFKAIHSFKQVSYLTCSSAPHDYYVLLYCPFLEPSAYAASIICAVA
jgi:hypothetical protein